MILWKNKTEKKLSLLVFGIYLALLCWLVLFKFATSPAEIPHLRGINLIPFHYDVENTFHSREVLDNVLAFVPAGFYFTAFLSRKHPFAGVGATFLLSVLFETAQWIFAIGATDITDVITNTLGGLIGMLFFLLMGRLSPGNRMKIVNILGLIIEFLGCTLLAVLLIAN